jgi:hypothetical protein
MIYFILDLMNEKNDEIHRMAMIGSLVDWEAKAEIDYLV